MNSKSQDIKGFPQHSNKNNKTPADSITKVNPFRKHGVGLWKGNRKVVGIRIDEDLYNAFKPVAKRVFGSVCRPVEAFMASVLAMAETGVNFGNTIEIHEIRIERNIRARRALVVDKPATEKPLADPDQCGFNFCKNKPVTSGIYLPRNQEYLLCADHLAEVKWKSREWKVLAHG